VFGLSVRPSYSEYVGLMLNLRRAVARQASAAVLAKDIGDRGLASEEYCGLDAPDERAATQAYETAVLRQALRRNR
jgi:hypothetical protein